ncbi:nuclear transport factor 2 family protein [Bradyrhizobium uaiense]|nr:ester cyclase [Bradyrhizobium uaiense]
MSSASNPTEVAKKLYAAYDEHNHDTIRKLYCDDATHDEVSQLRTRQGAAEIALGMQKLFAWLPDIWWEVKAMVAGDHGAIAVVYIMHATAPQKNGAAKTKAISLRGVQIIEVVDGRIRRSEDYWDAATFQRQIS